MERLIKTANTELTMSGQRQEMKRKSSTRSGEKDDERMDEEEARIGCELSDSNTRHHNSSSLNEACLTSVCLHTGKCAPCSHLHLLSEDCANQAALLPRVIVTTLCWETMIIIMFSCSAGAHGDSSTLLQQVTEREELWWQPERGPGEHGDPAPSLQLAARLKVSTPNTWTSSVRPPPSPPISISSVTQLSLWMVPPGVLKLHVHISNTSLKLWHVFFNHSIIKWSDCVNSAFVRSLTYRVRMCTNVCVITETHWSEHFSFLLVFVPIAGIIVLMLAASNTRMPSITCCRNHHCCSCVRSCSYGHGERGCQQRGSPGTFFHWVIGELVNPELLSYTSLQLYPPATAAAGPTPTANIMNTFPSSPETFASSFVSLSVLLVPLFLFLYFFSINFLVFV